MTLRIQSLVEWREVSVSTCDAFCQLQRESAQRREPLYVPRRKVLAGMGRPQSCGDVCEPDPEGPTRRILRQRRKEGRTLPMEGMAHEARLSSKDSWCCGWLAC